MISALVRRAIPLVGVAMLMGAVVYRQPPPVVTSDMWMHLRFGEEFMRTWSVESPGHLGGFDTADWIPTQWLSQEGMAYVEHHLGIAGVLWLASTVTLAFIVVTYTCARIYGAPLPAAFATVACFFAAAPGMTARPQAVSYLLVVVVLCAWMRTVGDGRPRWWLLAVAWVWPALHGLWIIGVLVGVVVVAGLAVDRRHPPRALGRLALIPLASAIVPALGPLGASVFSSLVAVGSRSEYFAEWGSPTFRAPSELVVVLLIGVPIVVGLKRRHLTWTETFLLVFAAMLALYSIRTGTVAAIVVTPLFAQAIQEFVPANSPISRGEWLALVAPALACCVALAATSAALARGQVVPGWLDSRLTALPSHSRVLNDWDTGTYFLWKHPQLDLVMHGYGDVFTPEELRRNAGIARLDPGWSEAIDELDVDYALVVDGTPLEYALSEVVGWREVESDSDYALLTPP